MPTTEIDTGLSLNGKRVVVIGGATGIGFRRRRNLRTLKALQLFSARALQRN